MLYTAKHGALVVRAPLNTLQSRSLKAIAAKKYEVRFLISYTSQAPNKHCSRSAVRDEM